MEHVVGTRAASLTGAALLVGGMFWAASLARFQFESLSWPEPPTIGSILERPKDPPPPMTTISHPTPVDYIPAPIVSDEPVPTIAEPTVVAFDQPRGDIAPPGPVFVTSPHWLRRPSGLTTYYPDRALRWGMAGQVRLDCVVTPEGWLRPCVIMSESPTGWGFGSAALRIAEDHRMTPATRDGTPVEARYRMTVPFRVE